MPASASGRHGWRMPTRHRCPLAGDPKAATSPPPLMSAPGTPASRSTPSARSVAHPLTRPVGSNPPGIAQGSNQPSETCWAARHSPTTWWNSGGIWPSVASPRRYLLTGLVSSQVLKSASQRCRTAQARGDRGPHRGLRQGAGHDGEGEDGPHRRLGMGQRGRAAGGTGGAGHLRCSLSSADWTESAYAWLVYVAPLTALIRALWAASTS